MNRRLRSNAKICAVTISFLSMSLLCAGMALAGPAHCSAGAAGGPRAAGTHAAAAESGAAGNGTGTAEDPYRVPRTDSEISVDAVLSEDAWQNALEIGLNYEVEPGENVTPPVRTEVLLAYDQTHLYIAFRCHDPDPSAIRAHLCDRDEIDSDDWVGVILDTFNDERRSFDLLVNPLGVQEDFIESQTGGGSWDAIWNSAGRITEWGYAVELAVPFNQLRFQRTDSPQVWSFDAVRSYPRSQRHHIGTFPRDRGNNCYLCQAIKISGFEGVSPGRNIEISPTLTTVRTDQREDFPEGGFEKENQDADFGVTATWGMTPNLTLNATANPDFSQVEADAMQLDVNQPFALYYDEKRPFFTEGYDFFRTLKTAIYTRTMRDPSWGLKMSGKEGANTLGAYVVRDDVTNLIFPGSQGSSGASLSMESTASVFRYKRDLGSRYTIGALFTDREGEDYFNRLAGLDIDFRPTPTNQIQLQVLRSSTEYPAAIAEGFGQDSGTLDDSFIAFEYDRYSRSVGWWLDYDNVGRDFRADLGFIPRVGFQNLEGGLLYFWNAKPGDWWSRITAGCEANYYEDEDGLPLDRGGNVWLDYSGFLQSWFYARGSQYQEHYNGSDFDLRSYTIQGGMRPTGDLSFGLVTAFGDRIDYANTRPGERVLLNPFLGCNLGRHLNLSFDHVYEQLDVEERRLYTANISQLTAIYQLNVRTFLRSILQYADFGYDPRLYIFERDAEEQHFFAQLLFSYKINPRTVLFLGYNGNHLGGESYDLTHYDRTFFLKLGYAFVR